MLIRNSISVLTLATALAAGSVAHAAGVGVSIGGEDSPIGADVGVDVGGSGGGVSVDADVGVGNDSGSGGVGVDAGASVGGDEGGVDAGASVTAGGDGSGDGGVGVDAGASVGGSDGSSLVGVDAGVTSGDSTAVDANVDVLDNDSVVDADVTLGGGNTSGGGGSTQPAVDVTATIDGGTRVLALGDETARADALVDILDGSNLADIDLDARIDDRRIAIVSVDDVLSDDSIARIEARLGDTESGRDNLITQIEASADLSSVLDREGIAPEDVLAVQIDADGLTEVFVRNDDEPVVANVDVDALGTDVANADVAVPGNDNTANVDAQILPNATDLADVDVNALSDEELAAVDVNLLPDQNQRRAVVLRLLSAPQEGAEPNGEISIIDLDAVLGDAAAADVDATLGTSGQSDALAQVRADIDLTDALQDAGIAPEAVAAVRIAPGGTTNIFVRGDANDETPLATANISLGNGGATGGDNGGTGGSTGGDGGNAGGNGGTGTDNGAGTGTGNDTGTGNGGTGAGGDGNGTGAGNDNGTSTGSGSEGSNSGSTGGTVGDNSGGAADSASHTAGDEDSLVAAAGPMTMQSVPCAVATTAMQNGGLVTPADVGGFGNVMVISASGCDASGLDVRDLPDLQGALAQNEDTMSALTSRGFETSDILGAARSADGLVVYVKAEQD